jgi:flagellar protein FliO/FliZ
VDLSSYLQFALALLFVLALIGVLAFGARRLGFAPRVTAGRGRRRLAIVEVLAVDTKRRLVLVRRDGVEHLLLLGATHDTVVETGIAPPEGSPPGGAPEPSTRFGETR